MGRHQKVLERESIDVREVGYYSTPQFIADYISERLLMINPNGKKVLDPGCGKEELLQTFFEKGLEVDGIDVRRYKDNYRCNFKNEDFIKFYEKLKSNINETQISFEEIFTEEKSEGASLDYDFLIANPPYNCHEVNYIKNNKKELSNLFYDVGVHNMYSMYISALIDIAKEGAVIGLITADSFLTAKSHGKLRRKILETCSVHEITMCSNDLFHEQNADVRTSIIILQKGKGYQGEVIVNNRPLSKEILKNNLQNQLIDISEGMGNTNYYKLENILLDNPKDNHEFIVECPDDIKVLFSGERIGEKYRCVTGISTGKDKDYLSTEKNKPFTIPFYKNPGKNRFYANNYIYLHEDFLKFDKEIKNFMVRNKDILYKPGITCSSMGVEFTAARLPENSTYGVNPNIICDDSEAWWLLAYLNSSLVSYIVRGILIRSNMITSGYVSRIPLPSITNEDKEELGKLAKLAYNKAEEGISYEEEHKKINKYVNTLARVSDETIRIINKFNLNLIKNT